jgi:hypothetical protein
MLSAKNEPQIQIKIKSCEKPQTPLHLEQPEPNSAFYPRNESLLLLNKS